MSLYEDSIAIAYGIVLFLAVPWALVVFPALWQGLMEGNWIAANALENGGWAWAGIWLVVIVALIVIAGAILD